jgi:hypothetical protein
MDGLQYLLLAPTLLLPCCCHCLQDVQKRLKGFSISGSLDPSLRDYRKMWQQIRAYREQQGQEALQHFQLNILGDMFAGFEVPGPLQSQVISTQHMH